MSKARTVANGIAQAAGGGTDNIFYENDVTINSNYTLSSNSNAVTAGPISIADGATVSVPDGGTWVVV